MKKLIGIIFWMSLAGTVFAECPKGTTLDKTTNTCRGDVSCADGDYNPDMGECESLPSKGKCPKGSKLDRMTDVCASSPICPPSTVFDEGQFICIGLPR